MAVTIYKTTNQDVLHTQWSKTISAGANLRVYSRDQLPPEGQGIPPDNGAPWYAHHNMPTARATRTNVFDNFIGTADYPLNGIDMAAVPEEEFLVVVQHNTNTWELSDSLVTW